MSGVSPDLQRPKAGPAGRGGGPHQRLHESDKPLVTEVPPVTPAQYEVTAVHLNLRALLPQVVDAQRRRWNLVDVRSPDEFTGKVIAPPGMTETDQRGYCRIGERSSHTWFVPKYLLGFNNVKNYYSSRATTVVSSACQSKRVQLKSECPPDVKEPQANSLLPAGAPLTSSQMNSVRE